MTGQPFGLVLFGAHMLRWRQSSDSIGNGVPHILISMALEASGSIVSAFDFNYIHSNCCMQAGPSVACKVPHGSAGTGGENLPGGFAYGIPFQTLAKSESTPTTCPVSVSTITEAASAKKSVKSRDDQNAISTAEAAHVRSDIRFH